MCTKGKISAKDYKQQNTNLNPTPVGEIDTPTIMIGIGKVVL